MLVRDGRFKTLITVYIYTECELENCFTVNHFCTKGTGIITIEMTL